MRTSPGEHDRSNPTAHFIGTLLVHPAVIQALAGAWTDSQVDDPANRHEEGGWIYLDLATGDVVTRRASSGTRTRLSLANPPLLLNHVIVGTFNPIRIQLRRGG
jgi:hypothetical protein